jgi:hypothetical protein
MKRLAFILLSPWLGVWLKPQEQTQSKVPDCKDDEIMLYEGSGYVCVKKWEPQCWCGRKGKDVIEMDSGMWKCNSQPSAHVFSNPNWEKEDKEQ